MQQELNLSNMEHNAIEALGELQGTLDRIRFRQGLPPHRGWADKRMAYDTRRHPLTECGLEVSFEEALHHLNWSWNERRLTDAEIRNRRTPQEFPKSWKLISPREMLLWVCADGRFKDENAAQLVRMLDEKEPGIVAQTSDVFGDTPLWYTLYRYQYGGHVNSSGWREDSSKLAKLLQQLGCDPHAINRFGVSWSEVVAELKRLR